MILKNLESMIVETCDSKSDKSETDAEKKRFHQYIQSKLGSITRASSQSDSIKSNEQPQATPPSPSIPSKLADTNSLACLSQSISSYLITAQTRKSGDQLKHLTIRLYDAVNLWLSRLFRFHDSSTLFHDQEFEGLVRMCNMMLNFKFDGFQSKGYTAIRRQPAIYVSEASKYSQPDFKELISIQVIILLNFVFIYLFIINLTSRFFFLARSATIEYSSSSSGKRGESNTREDRCGRFDRNDRAGHQRQHGADAARGERRIVRRGSMRRVEATQRALLQTQDVDSFGRLLLVLASSLLCTNCFTRKSQFSILLK